MSNFSCLEKNAPKIVMLCKARVRGEDGHRWAMIIMTKNAIVIVIVVVRRSYQIHSRCWFQTQP